MCCTFCIIHSSVMMIQRNSHCFRYSVQFKPVQLRKKKPCHSHSIHRCKVCCNPKVFTVFFNKAHIKFCIVCDHDRVFTKFHKTGQQSFNRFRTCHHTVIDTGQFFNAKRNRDLWIYKFRKSSCDLSILHFDCPDFNNFIRQSRKTGSLNIKDHIFSHQRLSFTVLNNSFQIIHKIGFHTINHFKI